jgi:hypothetical protein
VITLDNVRSGSIWVAADKALGDTAVALHEHRAFPDFEGAVERAERLVSALYPAWSLQDWLPVVYSYPRLGILLELAEPETSETIEIVLDIYDLSEAPRVDDAVALPERGATPVNVSSSFLDGLTDDQRLERARSWQAKHDWDMLVLDLLAAHGDFPEALKNASMSLAVDLHRVMPVFYDSTACTIYTVRNQVSEYCQSDIPYCAAAIGRNIASYYGVSHLESKVAGLMGITDQVWPTVAGEIQYYSSPNGLDKAGTVSYTTATSAGTGHLQSWQQILASVQRDQAFLIPSSIGKFTHGGNPGPGGWQQPGHWVALYGMKVCTSPNGQKSVQLGIFDPYPPSNCQATSFQSFDALKGKIRSHTIPMDAGNPPWYPPKHSFEPWKCKLHWYRAMYPASCKKIDDLLRTVGLGAQQSEDEWFYAPEVPASP